MPTEAIRAQRRRLFRRTIEGSVLLAGSYVVTQVLRLVSNLILTRLLFPEAFGLMSLVSVFIIGIVMFSDVGIGLSVTQNRRGDDKEFLKTAFTLQAIRGVILFLAMCLLAVPLAALYNEPELAWCLPVASIVLLFGAVTPIRVETASRHMLLGRLTAIDLLAQFAALIITIYLAWLMRSAWALVIGNVLGAAIKLALHVYWLPGARSQFGILRSDALDIIRFGVWIIPSTICGFVLGQGDKVILGIFMSLQGLGIYNIGQFLASAPLLLAAAVTQRILVPFYREFIQHRDTASEKKLRLLRFSLTGGLMLLQLAIVFLGYALVQFMYDERYEDAGAVVVLVGLSLMPQLIGLTYDRAALAVGDSKAFFFSVAFRAIVLIVSIIIGGWYGGLVGAIVAQGVASVIGHLSLIWLARKLNIWDSLHDLVFFAIMAVFGALAIYLNFDLVQILQEHHSFTL